jgi:hypothetical protein
MWLCLWLQEADDFDRKARELLFDAKVRATDRTKTDEELAKEELEKLEGMCRVCRVCLRVCGFCERFHAISCIFDLENKKVNIRWNVESRT